MGEFNSEACRAELLANVKSNQYRIDDLEKQQTTIQEILLSLKEIAVEMKGMKEAQDDMSNRLKEIEKKPALTLDKIIGVIITVVVTAAITKLILN